MKYSIYFVILLLFSACTSKVLITENAKLPENVFIFKTEDFYKKLDSQAQVGALLKEVSIELPTPLGKQKFLLQEVIIGEKRVPEFYTFRGVTDDQQITLSLTIRPKILSAVMRYQTQNYFIESIPGKLNQYRLQNGETIRNQPNDHLK